MATEFSAREVCELALQKVGAYSLADSAADGVALERALSWLDVAMADEFGHQRFFFLVPETVSMTLTGGTKEYDILDTLGSAAPELGVQFPIRATLVKGDNRTPLDIVTLEEYEAVPNKETSGTPDKVFIDRLAADPTLFTHPVLGSDATGYSIDLVVQTYTPDFHQVKNGEVATGLRKAWQLWAVEALAYQIGSGPIRVLEERRLERIEKDRDKYEARLMAFENRQHATTSGRVAAKDL